ncbi:MAG: hypothetical protein FIA99_12660 [Ruminiclostridium sp.]|nr:hypothetical protein [Ruminiclostridium sp.]
MKKLVLIMVFVLLMALFIAFNYLLWDRESKINENRNLGNTIAANSANMDAQSRDIKRLENDINQYLSDISKLEKEGERLSQKNQQLENDKTLEAQKTRHRIDIINILKQNADINLFEAPIKKWVDAVDAGDYGEAYRLEFDNAPLQNDRVKLEDYTSALKNNVKSIKIKEVILDKDTGKADGEIFLTATLDVRLTEKPEKDFSRFIEGLNEIKFKLDYNAILNEFFILEITE